jgi:DNA-binding transcriptional regulator LsrR (DeoR family)
MKPEKGAIAAALEAGKAGLDTGGAALPDEEEQRRTRIAWLYYIEGKTQSGTEKTPILRTALTAGYATVLITDEKTARLLVGGSA